MKSRVDRLCELLPGVGVEMMLVTALTNVRYLTGYTGSNGLALIGTDARTFITDFRYVEQAGDELDPSFERRIAPVDLLQGLGEALPGAPLRLGFEDAHISVREHGRLGELLPDSVTLVAAGGLVERLRAVKEPQEIERIRAAAAIADGAFQELIGEGLAGRSERELADALERAMRARGALRPSFETIVAAGAHGARPHAQPRNVELGPGQLVVIDWGAQVDGYCSDCTRTVATGAPSEDARRVYELVLAAQLTGVEAIEAGADARAVDATARKVIEAGGEGEHFGHGLGHGVGLEVHEVPRLTQRTEDELQAGNVVTVEPGVYLPERFGVRIEDLVVVTEGGCEVLTSVPKGLIVTG